MKVAILHYSVPPVVGGVEAVIQAHTHLLVNSGHSVKLIAGAGNQSALPVGAEFIRIPEMDSLHPHVVEVSQQLEAGQMPDDFERLAGKLEKSIQRALESTDRVIIHNIFTKHFNLPLTVALVRLLDNKNVRNWIAWCHDFSWTSPHSRPKLHQGYPWDLLCTYRDDVTYVTVSNHRQEELARLFQCPNDRIQVIYDGVDPVDLFGLSKEGRALLERIDVGAAELILLMPVRITQAKNIELALKVIAILKAAGIQPKLIVTGPPDPQDPADMQYYQSLISLRHQLGVEREARFVYEAGPEIDLGYTIGSPVVAELYRLSDALFIPSHREGFGMPILEAGLIGRPIFTTAIPAAEEVGGAEVMRFSPDDPPEKVAGMILAWKKSNPIQVLRQRVRHDFTWQSIFQQKILPLLTGGKTG